MTGVPAPLRRNRAGTTRGRLVAGGLLTALLLFTALAGPFLVPSDPYGIQLDRALEPPSLAHPLGRVRWEGTFSPASSTGPATPAASRSAASPPARLSASGWERGQATWEAAPTGSSPGPSTS